MVNYRFFVRLIAYAIFLMIMLLPLAPSATAAGNWALQVSGMSYHYDREKVQRKDLQESNPGAAIQYQSESGRYVINVGGYSNSYGERSYYALSGIQWRFRVDWFHVGIAAGVISGYQVDTGMEITPALVPFAELGPVHLVLTPWFVAANITVARF